MINITFYFYRFLDSLRSLEMTDAASRLDFSTRFARSK